MNEKLKERIDLFTHVVRGDKKPNRIPHVGNIYTWFILDSGYTLTQALTNNDIMLDVMRKAMEKYEIDNHIYTGHRNPVLIESAFGKNNYIINDEKGYMNVKDVCVMEADEYDELGEDLVRFRWTKSLPRFCPGLAGTDNKDKFIKAIMEYQGYLDMQKKIAVMMTDEFNVPLNSSMSWGNPGIEELFNFIRGIKGLSVDLRRNFEKVAQTCDALDPQLIKYHNQDPDESFYGRTNAAFDLRITMLAHTILNPKQFERLYVPYLKRLSDIAERFDKTVFVFGEGFHERFYDYYRDLPQRRFCFLPEQDDIYKFKKALPNITPAGGMPQHLMANGTPQECVDFSRKLIDEIGNDGKYVFALNKMISYKNDLKAENFKAVTEFVSNYKI